MGQVSERKTSIAGDRAENLETSRQALLGGFPRRKRNAIHGVNKQSARSMPNSHVLDGHAVFDGLVFRDGVSKVAALRPMLEHR